MVIYCHSPHEWAECVIANAKIGNPAVAAYEMVRYCNASFMWAVKVIDNATIGEVDWATHQLMYYMAHQLDESKEKGGY